MALGAVDSHFAGASNLVGTASDAPDLSSTTSLKSTFEDASKFNGDLSNWNVSSVENMSAMFNEARVFNNKGQPLNWGNKIQNVTDMSGMFWVAPDFNQDISDWTVSNVKNMSHMFQGASSFNQDISQWDVDNVTQWAFIFHVSGMQNNFEYQPPKFRPSRFR